MASALLGAGPAAAGGRWSGVLAATTDYVYRGVSQTHNQPALQGDVHYETAGSLVVGMWASTVQPTSDTQALELDAYLGQSWLLADELLLSVTAVHYAYLDTSTWGPKDYDEILASLGYRGLLFATVAWSPNTWRYSISNDSSRHSAASYEVATHLPFARDWYLSGGVGYYDLGQFVDPSYWYWNAGVGYGLGRYQVDLSYFGNDAAARPQVYGDSQRAKWALTLTWHF